MTNASTVKGAARYIKGCPSIQTPFGQLATKSLNVVNTRRRWNARRQWRTVDVGAKPKGPSTSSNGVDVGAKPRGARLTVVGVDVGAKPTGPSTTGVLVAGPQAASNINNKMPK